MRRFAISILCLLCFSPAVFAQVEPYPQSETVESLQQNISETQQKVEELESEIARMRSEIEHYQFLREDMEQYRQFIEREQTEFKDFLERLITISAKVIGVVVTVASAMFAFLNIKTVNDVSRTTTRMYRRKLNQIKRSAELRMQRVAEKAVAELENQVNVLLEIVQNEISRRQARVIVCSKFPNTDALDATVLALLSHQGIQISARILPADTDSLVQSIENNQIDILVYFWHPEPGTEPPQDPILDQLILTLQERSLHVPVLIYAKTYVRGQNQQLAQDYGYATFANTPVTLVTNLNALIPTFGRRSHR